MITEKLHKSSSMNNKSSNGLFKVDRKMKLDYHYSYKQLIFSNIIPTPQQKLELVTSYQLNGWATISL